MEAPPPGLRTDGESRGDAGNLIIVDRLLTVPLDIVPDDVSYCCRLLQLRRRVKHCCGQRKAAVN